MLVIGLFIWMVIFVSEGVANTQIFIEGSPTPPTAEELKAIENAPIGGTFVPSGKLLPGPDPRTYSPLALENTTTLAQGLAKDFLTP